MQSHCDTTITAVHPQNVSSKPEGLRPLTEPSYLIPTPGGCRSMTPTLGISVKRNHKYLFSVMAYFSSIALYRKMAQWLRARTTLLEDPSSVSSTHICWLTACSTSSRRCVHMNSCAHPCTETCIHTHN